MLGGGGSWQQKAYQAETQREEHRPARARPSFHAGKPEVHRQHQLPHRGGGQCVPFLSPFR